MARQTDFYSFSLSYEANFPTSFTYTGLEISKISMPELNLNLMIFLLAHKSV